jgi:hypothetical protein
VPVARGWHEQDRRADAQITGNRLRGRDLRGWAVGLPGLEPGTSSLSAITRLPLCNPAFSQVVRDRQGRSNALLATSFQAVQASQAVGRASPGDSRILEEVRPPGPDRPAGLPDRSVRCSGWTGTGCAGRLKVRLYGDSLTHSWSQLLGDGGVAAAAAPGCGPLWPRPPATRTRAASAGGLPRDRTVPALARSSVTRHLNDPRRALGSSRSCWSASEPRSRAACACGTPRAWRSPAASLLAARAAGVCRGAGSTAAR